MHVLQVAPHLRLPTLWVASSPHILQQLMWVHLTWGPPCPHSLQAPLHWKSHLRLTNMRMEDNLYLGAPVTVVQPQHSGWLGRCRDWLRCRMGAHVSTMRSAMRHEVGGLAGCIRSNAIQSCNTQQTACKAWQLVIVIFKQAPGTDGLKQGSAYELMPWLAKLNAQMFSAVDVCSV